MSTAYRFWQALAPPGPGPGNWNWNRLCWAWDQPRQNLQRKAPASAMPWPKRTQAELKEFLQPSEWEHVHLAAQFCAQQQKQATRQSSYSVPEAAKRIYCYRQNDRLSAMILWSQHERLLFDCLGLRMGHPDPEPLSYPAVLELRQLLRKHLPSQFIGLKTHYEFLQNICDMRLRPRHYYLMLRKFRVDQQNGGGELPRGLHLQKLSTKDFDAVIPIEHAYYEEEVLLEAATPHIRKALTQQCYSRLDQFLQYGIFENKQLLARVMINAYSLQYWQLGGIYTVPAWRGQGLARFLVHKICHDIEQQGRRALLFVRIDNQPAIRLYKNCGFETVERLVISQN